MAEHIPDLELLQLNDNLLEDKKGSGSLRKEAKHVYLTISPMDGHTE